MRETVIVEAVRTPVGKRNGGLSAMHAADLSAVVLNELVERAGIDPNVIDDVVWGCVSQVGDQSSNIGRYAVLAAGWPEHIPGTTINRACGSSQQALDFAAQAVMSGQQDVVVAGGVEVMSRVPLGSARASGQPYGPKVLARYDGFSFNQGISAEMIAKKWGFSRTRLDEYSALSHERAAAAQDSGAFTDQIVPVFPPHGEDGAVVAADEGIRRGTTVEKLAGLKPAFDEAGVIHAGNSSQISDGAAALLVTTSDIAVELGLTPLVRYVAGAVTGADPVLMLTGPIPATEKVLAKAGRLDFRCRRVRSERGLRPGSVGMACRNRCRPGSAEPARRSHRAGSSARRIGCGADDPHGASHARQRDSLRVADHVRGRRHRQRHHRRTCFLTGKFMRRDLFTEDHEAFRELARDFIDKEVVPAYPEWEKGGRMPRDVFKQMGALGMLGMAIPEEYGGAGMPDYRYNVVLQEEAAKALVTLSTVRTQLEVILPYFLHYANEEQRKRWFPGLADGTLLTAVAMTEPGTGSDLAGMRTTAVRDGDHWIVNGAKTFITGGMQADLVIVVARTATDPDNRRKGLTLLVVEDGMAGFTRGRELEKMGCKVQDTAELSFVDVRVPVENVLGEEGEAFGYLGHNLPQERLTVAVGSVAQARSAIAAAIDYTKDRKAFGQPVASFQNTKFELAACSTEVEAGQAMLDRAVALHVEGELSAADAARVKLFCTEMQARVIDRCLQLFGGYGYMMEYPIARLYTDARVARIYAGTSEVMKVIIAKSLGL